VKVDAGSGTSEPIFDAAKMESALLKLAGVPPEEARRIARSRDLIFDRTYRLVLATIADDLYLYSTAGDTAVRLTNDSGEEEEPTFSPNGAMVAFVRGNNLFVVDIAMHRETMLTEDGSSKILNGLLDWVYEEEIYGRGEKRAYWWTPDSVRIAFLRTDDTPVSTYVTLDDISYEPRVEPWSYPRAGDRNPEVRLGVVLAAGGSVRWMDTSKYTASDHLIVRVAWTPDSRRLVYAVQDRTQTWVDLNIEDATGGNARTVFRESSKYWISADDLVAPAWLEDGSFLWLSGRSGWPHLYHYSGDGALIKPVTSGKWEVRTLHGVDTSRGWIYFSGTERSHIGGDVYRIKLDGTSLERVSKAPGTHSAEFSPGFAYYIDRWSDAGAGPAASQRRQRGPSHRRQQRAGAVGLHLVQGGVPAGSDARRVRDGGGDDQAARLRPAAPVSRLPVHLWRAARSAGKERVGWIPVHVPPAARTERHHRLDLR
jgi:dipeptidyl-peptidase-4